MSEIIGIIGAMQVEIDLLVNQLEDLQTTSVADMTFYSGRLHGTDTVIVRCGIGKVSAAMTTQALIDRYAPHRIINTGVAGALDPTLDIGDLVVSSDLVQHDMDVTGLGYKPGVIPELDGLAQVRGKLAFETDDQLCQVIASAATEVDPHITVVRGRIVSGDQFVCTREQRERIIATFGASCCEMEGAAIAQVCWRNGIPFVVARTISDKADDSSKVEYRDFEQKTAERCAAIISKALNLL